MAVDLAITHYVKMTPIGTIVLAMNAVIIADTKADIIQTHQGLHHMGIIAIGNHSTGGQQCKLAEGFLHILQIAKVVQMVCFHVQNYGQRGVEIQERIKILTTLQNNGITIAHTVTCAQQGQIATDHNRRIFLCRHEDMGHHGSTGGLTMGAGNAHSILISLHDHTPSLCTLKHRNTHTTSCCNLGIIIMGSSGTNNTIRTGNILFTMANGHMDALCNQFICRDGRIHIRAGNMDTHALQDQSQGTHGNTANTHQMHTLAGLQQLL